MPPSDSGPYTGERPRVLIAEDDTVTRLILKHWIKRWGYDIVVVDNGLDAWEIMQQERPPELVIMDWVMPWTASSSAESFATNRASTITTF